MLTTVLNILTANIASSLYTLRVTLLFSITYLRMTYPETGNRRLLANDTSLQDIIYSVAINI